MIYWNYIPHDWIPSLIEKLGSFLGNSNNIIWVYSACALEKILNLMNAQSMVANITHSKYVITKDTLWPLLVDLLRSLNDLITKSDGLN